MRDGREDPLSVVIHPTSLPFRAVQGWNIRAHVSPQHLLPFCSESTGTFQGQASCLYNLSPASHSTLHPSSLSEVGPAPEGVETNPDPSPPYRLVFLINGNQRDRGSPISLSPGNLAIVTVISTQVPFSPVRTSVLMHFAFALEKSEDKRTSLVK